MTAAIIACCEPAPEVTIKSEVWNSMGPVRILLEHLISQSKTFPPEQEERERQLLAEERAKILELENHISQVRATALGESLSIADETNSYLIHTVCLHC